MANEINVEVKNYIFTYQGKEGNFYMEIVGKELVYSGSLTPIEGAKIFFDQIGREVLEWARKTNQ